MNCSRYGLDIVDSDLSIETVLDALDRLDDAIDVLGEAIGRVGQYTTVRTCIELPDEKTNLANQYRRFRTRIY